MALEIERKYLEVDFDSLRRRLRQYGAQGGDVHLERNRIYDLPDGACARRNGRTMRKTC